MQTIGRKAADNNKAKHVILPVDLNAKEKQKHGGGKMTRRFGCGGDAAKGNLSDVKEI